MKKEVRYILINEKLEFVRYITVDELKEYWGVNTYSKVMTRISLGHKVDGYTVIEDEDDVNEQNKVYWQKFYEGDNFFYYVGSNGCFIRKNKTTNKSEKVQVYKHRKNFVIKIANKEMSAPRIYYEHFVLKRKLDTFYDIVRCESDTYDISKIKYYSRSEFYKNKSTNKKIGYFENGKLKRVFGSSREAAEALFTNRQSVLDTCNGKNVNMWGLDLRYIEKELTNELHQTSSKYARS